MSRQKHAEDKEAETVGFKVFDHKENPTNPTKALIKKKEKNLTFFFSQLHCFHTR